MIRTVKVNTSAPYNVLIGSGIFSDACSEILSACPASKYALITDSGVPKSILQKVKSGLNLTKTEVFTFEFERGEASKNFSTLFNILSFLAQSGFTREDAVIAVGGGVVGDLAGLAASLYMRGIKYVQVPTTLLAAIDSSVGGKTAVDLKEGKNLVGAFYQPSAVVCDVSFFDSLSQKDLLCGLGEGVKYGLLCGGELWQDVKVLSKKADGRPALSGLNIIDFVRGCVEYKAHIVSLDEREGGLRRLLNLGHTFGHAIEKLSDYTLAHGECVAKGIIRMMEFFPEETDGGVYKETKDVLLGLGFDISCPFADKELLAAMRADKKATANDVSMVLCKEPGRPLIKKYSFAQLEERI